MPKNSISERAFTKRATGYRWTTKDPIIDFMMEQWHKSGMNMSEMCRRSNLSRATIQNWEDGKTKRPHHVSVTWFLRALGLELVARPMAEINKKDAVTYQIKLAERAA